MGSIFGALYLQGLRETILPNNNYSIIIHYGNPRFFLKRAVYHKKEKRKKEAFLFFKAQELYKPKRKSKK